MTTTSADPFANVPYPAGAVRAYDWIDIDTPNPSRYWAGTSLRVGDAEIAIDGTQWADGRVERRLTMHADTDLGMPTDAARNIAAALIAAANEVDGMTSNVGARR
jgi:hypothetical protein